MFKKIRKYFYKRKMNKMTIALGNLGVAIKNAGDEFKKTSDILNEFSGKW